MEHETQQFNITNTLIFIDNQMESTLSKLLVYEALRVSDMDNFYQIAHVVYSVTGQQRLSFVKHGLSVTVILKVMDDCGKRISDYSEILRCLFESVCHSSGQAASKTTDKHEYVHLRPLGCDEITWSGG